MDPENAKKIILNAVKTTKPIWREYETYWNDMDGVFLSRAYEQGGFENWKFIYLLEKYEIDSIKHVGKILDNYNGKRKYDGNFARSLESPFYHDMKNGFYGSEGKLFYKSIKEFKGWKGQSFWRLLWWMLICCNYLKNNYNGSFSFFLKNKYAAYKNLPEIDDKYFMNISSEEWERFKEKEKPWNELYGVSINVFDFIMGDIKELKFVENSYKLDSANEHFLKVTGVFDGQMTRENVIKFIKELEIPYTLREVNKGLYSYCADSVKEYGFCREKDKCYSCNVNDVCEKKL